jgi:hypothetical protein
MKKITQLMIGLAIFTICSCSNFYPIGKGQVIPNIEFKSVNKIEVSKHRSEFKFQITDSIQIKEIINIFKDSVNYYKNDKIKTEGFKPIYLLNFNSKENIPPIQIYQNENMEKIILGYFKTVESESEKSEWRSYNRFYLNSKLLTKIKNLVE